MKLIILRDYDEASEWAAKYIRSRIISFNPSPDKFFTLGLPTGSVHFTQSLIKDDSKLLHFCICTLPECYLNTILSYYTSVFKILTQYFFYHCSNFCSFIFYYQAALRWDAIRNWLSIIRKGKYLFSMWRPLTWMSMSVCISSFVDTCRF